MFFFEKKNRKTFASAVAGLSGARVTVEQKFFASFFQKRRLFAALHERPCLGTTPPSWNTLG
jgi:hypothetical protein